MSGATGSDPTVDIGVERLLALLWLFRGEGTVCTSREIEECGYPDVHDEGSVGRKNFQNDRDRLSGLGIELRRTSEGTWRVESIADALDAHVTEAERAALTEAELLVGASGPESLTARRHVGPPHAALLLSATVDGHRVEFDYDGTHRRVQPLRMSISSQDRWYLHAHDEGVNEQRTFRVDKIGPTLVIDRTANVNVPKATTSKLASVHPSTWQLDPPVEAVVRFAHDPLPEWMAMLGPAHPTSVDDGPAQRRWTTTNHTAFVSRVLAIGPSAELVEPPALVALLRTILSAHIDARTSTGGA